MRAPALVDYGVATLTLAGERESGDLHLVKPLRNGVLIAVVDGLGHGAEAASAARAAVAALEREAPASALPLVQQCHRALVGTRGVVLSLAILDAADHSMTWLGVGNVEGTLLYRDPQARPAGPAGPAGPTDPARRARASLVTRGGIVGSELPQLRAEVISLTPGDTLIFATDGIRGGFIDGLSPEAPPQQVADELLTRYAKGTDDALVLVARYVGGAGAGG